MFPVRRPCRRLTGRARPPAARHAPGSRLRCQYVDVPQVAETAAFVGSQPWWLWGVEHGVNESLERGAAKLGHDVSMSEV